VFSGNKIATRLGRVAESSYEKSATSGEACKDLVNLYNGLPAD